MYLFVPLLCSSDKMQERRGMRRYEGASAESAMQQKAVLLFRFIFTDLAAADNARHAKWSAEAQLHGATVEKNIDRRGHVAQPFASRFCAYHDVFWSGCREKSKSREEGRRLLLPGLEPVYLLALPVSREGSCYGRSFPTSVLLPRCSAIVVFCSELRTWEKEKEGAAKASSNQLLRDAISTMQ
jgi:hypothetical protein